MNGQPTHIGQGLAGGSSEGRTAAGKGLPALPFGVGGAAGLILLLGWAAAAGDAFEAPTLTASVDGGAEFHSVQAAIAAAPAGGTVRLGPGVYEENLTITKSLKLQGAGWRRTTLAPRELWMGSDAEMRQAVRGEPRAAASGPARTARETDPVGRFLAATVRIESVESVELSGLKLTALGAKGKGRSFGRAVVEIRAAAAKITDCVVIGSPRDGLLITDGADAQIGESLIAAVWGTGIVLGERGAKANRVRIRACEVRNCYYAGIVIAPGNDATMVENCRISGAAWHGIRYDDVSPTLVGNSILANARCGVYASGQTAATIRSNLFYRNGMSGVSCWYRSADTLEQNVFAANRREGLAVLGASSPLVRSNIFHDNPVAVLLSAIADSRPAASEPGTPRLGANVFWQNATNVAGRPGRVPSANPGQRAISLEGGGAREAATMESLGEGNRIVDPKFSVPRDGDFRLAPDSPAQALWTDGPAFHLGRSPWPEQPEETAIIPDGDTRDSRAWKRP